MTISFIYIYTILLSMDGIEYPSLKFSIHQGSEGDFVEGEGAFSGRVHSPGGTVCLKKEGFIYPPKV